jgi:hypothetical protein
MIYLIIVCEGEVEDVMHFSSADEARGFSQGFTAGASNYAGSAYALEESELEEWVQGDALEDALDMLNKYKAEVEGGQ